MTDLQEEEERLQIETSKVKEFFDSEMKRLDERSKKLKEVSTYSHSTSPKM